ncbi:MAG: Lrp/AsnC family transcriptional regulator [Candidatus Woesearchaeota archaeon]|nr:Lrp/AsnC family transcriptional regulator [Candidatus Woesearchaeota archaeon]
MDSKDSRIIEILKQNSRESIRSIAKKADLRPSTVHQRLTKLKKDKVIEKFTVKLSNKAVGENFIVFMLLTTDKDLEPSFFENRHIKESFGVTGEHDLFLKLKFRDIDEFNDYIISLRKNKNIKKTLTMISTINIKEEI